MSKELSSDLRKSHFTMGQSRPNYSSEYKVKYVGDGSSNAANPYDRANMRASHFEYGNYNSKNFYATTNGLNFRAPEFDGRGQLNAEKLHDLRTHHFTLGGSAPGYSSTAQREFGPKEYQEGQKREQIEQRNKMRRHNFELAESKQNNYSSVYNREFNKNFAPEEYAARNPEMLKEQALSLRRTNLILGKDPNDHFRSEMQANFGQKDGGERYSQTVTGKGLRATNFTLGTAKDDFETVNTQYYTAHPPQKSVNLSKELASDLKMTHFTMGDNQPPQTSLMKASFTAGGTSGKGEAFVKVRATHDHVTLGENNHPLKYNTAYKDSMVPPKIENNSNSRAISQDRGTSFILGQAKGPYLSEAKSHFTPFPGAEKAELHAGLKNDLRSSHFRFNDVKAGLFKTTGQDHYTNKIEQSLSVNKGDHSAMKHDLTRNHFSIGGEGGSNFGSVTKSVYTNPHGQPAKLDDHVARDLRSHHHSFGEGKIAKKSYYGEEYTWKR
eukprot:TRINITY_DN7622_c0_g1_i4.p1 TRINITY_DN7622_c0_g1~~TRINITY_DN7622_c0_g1_i4.p1  ORF type:complete len:496 (-),score=99.24 TRINITY_DN7622_c0_g1_i4:114-1601(-)